MDERNGHADGAAQDAVPALAEALEGADGLAADARLELLRRIEAGIAAELDGLDGL